MAKLIDLIVSGKSAFANDISAKNIYADKFVTTGGTIDHVVRGDGTLQTIASLNVANADKLDNIDSTGFLRYYNSNAAPANVNIVNTPSYVWTVSTTGGSVSTATKPSGIDNAWGVIHLHTHIGNYATQLGFGGATGRMYMRNAYNTATFGSWKDLAFTSDIPNVTNYYWANVKVSSASKSDTTPTFGNTTVTGELNAPQFSAKSDGIYTNFRLYLPESDSAIGSTVRPRLGRFDRAAGSVVLQLGTSNLFDIVDSSWSKVLFKVSDSAFIYKENTIWHAGNDGTGSGLDADLLDGNHASNFATAGHTHDYLPFYLKTTADCNSYIEGLTVVRATDSTAAHTNHSAFLTITNLGTPFQLQIPDSDVKYIYKRYKSGSSWSTWSKLSAGYADSAGSAASLSTTYYWANVAISTTPNDATTPTFANNTNLKGTDAASAVKLNFYHGTTLGGYVGYCNNSYGKYLELWNPEISRGIYIGSGTSLSAAQPYYNDGSLRKIWHEGNDGSGSGLDADLLDGYHSSDFYTKSDADNRFVNVTGDTMTGALTLPANGLIINSAGGDTAKRVIKAYGSAASYSGVYYLNFGDNPASGNCGEIGFTYAGSGSTSNKIAMGFYGGNYLTYYYNGYSPGALTVGTSSNYHTVLTSGNTYVTGGYGVINGTTITQVSNSDTLDGEHGARYTRALGSPNNVTFVVGGDANTYYPVVINNVSDYYPMQLVNISRNYAETAPDTWNTSTHRGGLTLTLLWNGSWYWDGNSSGAACYCVYHTESYSTMVGGLGNAVGGKVVWLRGGGAYYHLHSMNGTSATATVYTSTYTDAAGNSFAPKTSPSGVSVRWPGYAQGADYASSAGNADTLDGYHYNSFALSSHSHSTLETYFKFVSSDVTEAAVNLSTSTSAHTMTFYRNGISIPYQMDNSNDGGLLRVRGTTESNVIYEMATWDDSGAGETIQFNYYPTTSAATPTYSVSVPKKSGTIALTNDIPSSLPANGGNADTVDGQHFSYSNDSNGPTYLWATNSNGYSFLAARGSISVNYANSAGSASSASYASYLPTLYNGGQQVNPQTYFNSGIGVRVAMTGMSSKGTSYWSDTLWINGYSGGDVPYMCTLHFNRDGTPRMFISAQSNRATEYGTFYEILSSYNVGSYALPITGGTCTGNIYAPAFYESSDIRFKKNVKQLFTSNNIPQIKEFDWKNSGKHSYGLIAQELESMGYSELVDTKDDGYKSVNYTAALCLIIGKLQLKIKELEDKIKSSSI